MREKLALILFQTEESYRNINLGVTEKLDGWETWYAQWLLMLSDIRELLGVVPTQATLEKLLVRCDTEYYLTPTTKSWSQFVADEMLAIVSRYNRHKNQQSAPEK